MKIFYVVNIVAINNYGTMDKSNSVEAHYTFRDIAEHGHVSFPE